MHRLGRRLRWLPPPPPPQYFKPFLILCLWEHSPKLTSMQSASPPNTEAVIPYNMCICCVLQDACSGRTALHYAVEAENFILVNFLLENGCNVNSATFSGKYTDTCIHTYTDHPSMLLTHVFIDLYMLPCSLLDICSSYWL